MKTQLEYAELIGAFVQQEGECSWEDIRALITMSGFKQTAKRNWLFIRGAVQMLVDAGWIERTKDVHNETYRNLEG